MGETTDAVVGLVGRSLLRHAVVGVLTAGIGNFVMVVGDVMDAVDTLDTLDTLDTVTSTSTDVDIDAGGGGSSHGGKVSFCGGPEVPGQYHDATNDIYYDNQTEYNLAHKDQSQTLDELKKAGKA